MKSTTSRICKECGEAIEIKRNDVRNVVYYKKFYYHTSCFRKLAEQRSMSRRGKSEEWKAALDSTKLMIYNASRQSRRTRRSQWKL